MSAVWRSAAAARQVEAAYRRVLAGWPVPKREHHVPTGAGETFVLECGPEEAPPLLLLHGAQANAASWLFEAPLWSQHFRLFAVDVIGEAGFSAPVRPPLDGEAHALWLCEVLDALGIARADVVGSSLGGFLALDLARRAPQRVASLALLCPAGIGRQKNFLVKAAPLLLLGAWGRRRMREKVLGPVPKQIPPAAQPFVEMMSLIGRAIRPRVVRIPRLSDEELRALTMPVFAVLGGRDVLLDSAETRERLARCVKQAEVQFLPEALHFLPGQGAAILAFLRRAAALGATS